MDSGQAILIGKITGTHALRGVLRVYSHAESRSVFDPGRKLLLKRSDGTRQTVTVNWSRPHKQVWLVCLETIDDIDRAQPLVGGELFIDRAELPPLEEGTYYWQDLVGLAVTTLEGVSLGRLERIIPTGGNDVYVVCDGRGKGRREILIPALESVVREVDLERGTMRVVLPEGLVEY